MADPLVTIAITSYNHARWLPEAIESALGQTYPNVEIVIVDDGSTDESLSIAHRYGDANPERIRVLTHDGHANRGIAATANRATVEARGVYWSALPSDDILLPGKVAGQVELLESNPAAVLAYARTLVVDEDGRPVEGHLLLGQDITSEPRPLERLLRGNVVPGISALVRRDALLRLVPGLQRETLVYSDWDLWIRLFANGDVAFRPDVVALSRIHSSNTSIGIPGLLDRERMLAVLDTVAAESGEIGGGLAEPHTQAILQLELALRRYDYGDVARAEQHVEAAFAADPSLGSDPERLRRWLLPHFAAHAPPRSADAHAAAAKWLAAGAVGEPPRAAEADRNFAVWVCAHWPDGVPNALLRHIANLQRAQAAHAAERAGDRRRALMLALQTVGGNLTELRSSTFLRLLARLVVGPRVAAIIRRRRDHSLE